LESELVLRCPGGVEILESEGIQAGRKVSEDALYSLKVGTVRSVAEHIGGLYVPMNHTVFLKVSGSGQDVVQNLLQHPCRRGRGV